MIKRSVPLVAALGAATLLWGSQAMAHAKLLSSDPSPNAIVATPKSIHLQFSEEIAKKFSNFKLTDTDGNAVNVVAAATSDAKALDAAPAAALAPGVYTVSWTAVATDDGHKTSGSFSFTVK